MYKKPVLLLVCFLLIIPLFASNTNCERGKHNYVNYKCTKCGTIDSDSIKPYLKYDGYEVFFVEEYDEWGDPTGNSYLCFNTSNAKYTDRYTSEHDILAQVRIKPYMNQVEVAFFSPNGDSKNAPSIGSPTRLQYRTSSRFTESIVNEGRSTPIKQNYRNSILFSGNNAKTFIVAMLQGESTRFLLYTNNGNKIDFTIEYNPIIISRMLELCGSNICLTPKGDAITVAIELKENEFKGISSLVNFVFPYWVTSIPYGAFSDCDALSSVTIPSTVTAIGNKAFYDCDNLTKVTIPSSVSSIGRGAFGECGNLAIINSDISIEESAFESYLSTTDIYNVRTDDHFVMVDETKEILAAKAMQDYLAQISNM